MIQFYAPDILDTLTLPESDSVHCVRVLRSRAGDIIRVIDGRGNAYDCRITDPHPRHTAVEIVGVAVQPGPYRARVTVGVAPTKMMDRMEWMTEKLTEIGVDRITPVLCRHSERREIKVERLVKTAVSAMKQSLKATMPGIDPLTPLQRFIDEHRGDAAGTQRFIAYCADDVQRRELAREYRAGHDAVILIGPEGDFGTAEVRAAIDAGFVPVTLGPCRLRTETAALVACDTCRIIELNSPSNV